MGVARNRYCGHACAVNPDAAQTAAVDLPLDTAAPAAGRHMVREILRAWQVTQEYTVEACLIAVSELVTNAVVHGGGQVRLEAEKREAVIRLAVSDGGSVLPGRRDSGPLDTKGRGIALIEALATAWGVEEAADGGKSVWVDVKY